MLAAATPVLATSNACFLKSESASAAFIVCYGKLYSQYLCHHVEIIRWLSTDLVTIVNQFTITGFSCTRTTTNLNPCDLFWPFTPVFWSPEVSDTPHEYRIYLSSDSIHIY